MHIASSPARNQRPNWQSQAVAPVESRGRSRPQQFTSDAAAGSILIISSPLDAAFEKRPSRAKGPTLDETDAADPTGCCAACCNGAALCCIGVCLVGKALELRPKVFIRNIAKEVLHAGAVAVCWPLRCLTQASPTRD